MSATTERFSKKGRTYLLDGQRVPSVTTVIGTLDKPALVDWSAKTTARYAVEHWERLAGMDLINRYEELVAARRQKNKEAIVQGKRVHGYAERVIKGESIDEIPDHLRGAVQAYADMLDAWGFEAVLLETPVANTDYRYAGTLDVILTSEKTGPLLADIKTGKRAYSEVALQLAGYRNCDIYLEEIPQVGPRGGKQPSLWVEREMPAVNGAVVIHIAMETEESPAQVDVIPVDAGEDVFNQFLYLLEVHEGWIKRTGFNYRNDPSYNPVLGEPIYVEQANLIGEIIS